MKRFYSLVSSIIVLAFIFTLIPIKADASQTSTMRLSGADRYETAVAISQEGFSQADTVLLARGDDFPDALAATPLAHQLNGPILLTKPKSLSPSTKDELLRLNTKKVVILGGTGAVSAEVEASLSNLGLEVERISGKTRFETAEQIAQQLGGTEKAILAYGYNYPDALAIASYAAKNGYPILLTDKNKLPASTKSLLASKQEVILVGGTGAISQEVYNQIPVAKSRISGKNRFETATKILDTLNLSDKSIFIANGWGFPDALTGSVLAAKMDASLLLTNGDSPTPETLQALSSGNTDQLVFLGGSAALSADVVTDLQEETNSSFFREAFIQAEQYFYETLDYSASFESQRDLFTSHFTESFTDTVIQPYYEESYATDWFLFGNGDIIDYYSRYAIKESSDNKVVFRTIQAGTDMIWPGYIDITFVRVGDSWLIDDLSLIYDNIDFNFSKTEATHYLEYYYGENTVTFVAEGHFDHYGEQVFSYKFKVNDGSGEQIVYFDPESAYFW
ncbi:cell wall-binding repeat-containing protein [Bacillus suaedae]|uniref:Cell wall-binding repeat-containing protein n=1 Tax=Halalkalibacter suaedae TaxID=2822140 RepID=A0A940WYC0_9BACI|nr:cell wall-binding repeat-containing protein [Bacillus suaedae]MBP3950259.1 cell wall-binding repeat-containing protein [Bacillus suaedae]